MVYFRLEHVLVFMFIFARIAGMMQLAPVFSSKQIFSGAKFALIFWTSVLIMFVIPLPPSFPTSGVGFVLALLSEFLLGAIIGFTTQLLVIGIQFAGSLMDTQAGLSAASLLDPASGQSTTILSTLLREVAIIVFLLVDGHHMVMSAVFQSFRLLPISAPFQIERATQLMLGLGGTIFGIAIQLAAPILLIIFLVDFCFGMLSRVAPQVNVFQLGFQIKPIVAVFIFLATANGMMDLIFRLMESITETLLRLFSVM